MIKIRPSLLAILLIGLSLGFVTSPVMAAKSYYKWVDENGVTHYTARKPYDKDAEAISVSTGQPRDADGQPIRLEDEATGPGGQQSAASDPDANKDPERCKIAQSNLKVINENARIREKTDDGSFRFLSEEEKATRKKAAEQAISESC